MGQIFPAVGDLPGKSAHHLKHIFYGEISFILEEKKSTTFQEAQSEENVLVDVHMLDNQWEDVASDGVTSTRDLSEGYV